MENPPNLTFSEVTSVFSGLDHEQQRQELLNAFPYEQSNQITSDSNFSQARSVTSDAAQFKSEIFQEGARIFNGTLLYPFESTAELWTNKTDPFYFDGSENNSVFHLQENLIGRTLGSDLLEDPNKTYAENLLIMKENHGKQMILNDDYVKNLFMLNTSKGSQYYARSIQREAENLAAHTREERQRKNANIVEPNYTRDFPTGQFEHPTTFPTARLFLAPNDFGVANYRQRKMDEVYRRKARQMRSALAQGSTYATPVKSGGNPVSRGSSRPGTPPGRSRPASPTGTPAAPSGRSRPASPTGAPIAAPPVTDWLSAITQGQGGLRKSGRSTKNPNPKYKP